MDLLHYVEIIKRRIWVIVITTVVALLVAFAGRSLIPTSLEVTTILRFTPPENANFAYTERIMNTFIQIAESKPILDEVRDQLGLSPEQEIDLGVRILPNSELVEVKVKDPDPVLAQKLATVYTQVILDARPISNVRIRVIEPASEPVPPSLFEQAFLFGLIGIVGLVGGIGLAFLYENLDTGLRTSDVIESATGLPVLGEIPQFRGKSQSKFILDTFPYYDAFLRVRTNILSVPDLPKKLVIAITSAVPEDGKSTVVANIARSFGLAGLKTIVIDSDMIHPTINFYYDLENGTGLSSLLSGEDNLNQIIHETEYQNVDIITSGPPQLHTADLLRSDGMRKLLIELKRSYDVVLIDTPAILSVADGLMVVPQVDGVVVVSNFSSTSKADLSSCVQQMKSAQANLIGVIINKAKNPESQKYYHYYQRGAQRPKRVLRNPFQKSDQGMASSKVEDRGIFRPAGNAPDPQAAVTLPVEGEQPGPERMDSGLIEGAEASGDNGNLQVQDRPLHSSGRTQANGAEMPSRAVTETSDIEADSQNGKSIFKNGVKLFSRMTLESPLNISSYIGGAMSGAVIARKRRLNLAKTYIDDDLS